ncbi:MAG: hypothetical protein EXS10_10810 [Phycisphaerales bacterium]|nr:hypothetical protein [Phycisphaerales bacterium]
MKLTLTIQLSSSAAIILAASSTFSAQAQALHLLGAVPYSYATGVSDDGTVAVGYDSGSYWYWTEATWVVQLTGFTLPPGNGVGGSGRVRGDGSQMSCSTLVNAKAEGTIYDILTTETSPIGSLGFNCDIERCGIWDMSPDAQHCVGLIWNNGCAASGFHWNSTEGFKLLPSSYFFKPTRANAVSNNGNVIAGWNDDYNGYRQGAMWTRNAAGNYIETLMTSPPIPPSTVPSKCREAMAISGNGQWVYGLGKSTVDSGAAWRWSAATGYQSILPSPSTSTGYVTDANFDGSLLVGFFGMLGGGGGFIWIGGRGYVDLNAYALERGVTIPAKVFLSMPLAISADGNTITGTAFGPFGSSPFVLHLGSKTPQCPADVNGDGTVGAQDLASVLSFWETTEPSNDINGDGIVNAQDMAMILNAWGDCAP